MKRIAKEINDTLGSTRPDRIANVRVSFTVAAELKSRSRRRVLGGKRGRLDFDKLQEFGTANPPPKSWFDEG